MTTPPFWRFLPDEAPPDAAMLSAAARAGKGAFARCLRQARAVLGAQRTAALLRQSGWPRDAGRSFTLLLAAAFQPRAIEDALRVAFAIAGLAVEMRAVDGFGALGGAAGDPDDTLFDGLDMIFLPLLERAAGIDLAALVSTVSARSAAPVLVAGVGAVEPVAFAETVAVSATGPAIDERFGRTFGAIPSAEAADRLADAAAGFAAARSGLAPKLIVTDLDGTLWRETLGEDGVGALTVHRAYADALKALADRGLVLGIASRNDPLDVDAAFAAHPEWPVARDDFAAAAVGWEEKAVLVGQTLERLNLGAEHLLFVDDDPVNCASVAERYPESDVRLFRGEADDVAAMLGEDPLLASAGPTGAERGMQYRRRDAVERLRAATPDMGDFLRGLRTVVSVVPLDPAILPRAAELASRVNQFALNGWRPGAAELAERRSPLDFMLRLDDAFGAHGLVGLVLARREGVAVEVESFFLSCRAFGRGIEDAMLLALRTLASEQGCGRLVGTIEHLPRNEPARRCFSRYLDAGSDRRWTIPATGEAAAPEGVTIQWPKTTT